MISPKLFLSRDELIKHGVVDNPNMWIGDAWLYCFPCNRYTYHYAMSHRGKYDCFEVCKECQQYTNGVKVS